MGKDQYGDRTMDKQTWAPVQRARWTPAAFNFPTRVPWAMSAKAWEAYAAEGHGDQSHERLCERGGFGVEEFCACILGRGYTMQGIASIVPEDIERVRAMVESWPVVEGG